MKNEILDCSEMIFKTFSNLERESAANSNDLLMIWKKIITSINKVGQNLYEHSNIVEIKNGIMLVEADHSGWLQTLQMNSRYILRGFEMYAENLNIKSMVFRLKGSNAVLHEVDYKKILEKEIKKSAENIEEEEKILSQFNKNVQNTAPKQDLPQNLLDKFESLKKSVLTKDKNK